MTPALPAHLSPPVAAALAVLGIALVGAFDLASGIELRVYPLYFLPLALGAWHSGRWGAMALSAFVAAAWTVSNAGAGLVYSNSWVWSVNVAAQLIGSATVGLLIVELRARERLAAGLSRVDALTGLANGRALMERLELVRALAARTPYPFALAYIDLDDFKAVNDTRGHAEGDALLVEVSRCLRSSCRGADLAARIGGDELLLLLPDTDRAGAGHRLDRFFADFRAVAAERGWPVTASVGVLVAQGGPLPDAAALLRQADQVMYRAKRQGKGRVEYEELPLLTQAHSA